MKRIRRQFGNAFANAVMRLPTLVAYIEELREAGVRIKLCGGCKAKAYYDSKERTIYIGRSSPRNYKLISIGHEYSHALIRPTIDPVLGKTGRQEFIESCLEDEAEAIIHELKVVREILQAGMPIAERDLDWYHWYRYGGGRANLIEHIRHTKTSNSNETYMRSITEPGTTKWCRQESDCRSF